MGDSDYDSREEDFEVLDAVQSYSNMDRVRNFFSNFPVHPRRPEGQLAIGVAGGWVVGMISRRIGKTAATVIGGGFICIQLAYQTGYLSIDWDKVTRDVRRAQRVVDSEISLTSDDFQTLTEKTQKIIKRNGVMITGFLGGFCLGLAS